MIKLLKKLVEKISYEKRHQNALTDFSKRFTKYLEMNDDEFTMVYVEVSAKYEHKKLVLSAIAIAWITSIFMNIWKYFLDIITKLVGSGETVPTDQVLELSIFIVVIVASILILIGIIVLITIINDLYKLTKEKIFLENIKEKRQEKN
ncbi:MAG: hypothetical protein KHW81_15865 [[Clostridium] innocuum]|nr:hypothetical protein [[Clostridium] innocuum]MBS5685848.1 hypothetical protein [[Clostridium] innocuum]